MLIDETNDPDRLDWVDAALTADEAFIVGREVGTGEAKHATLLVCYLARARLYAEGLEKRLRGRAEHAFAVDALEKIESTKDSVITLADDLYESDEPPVNVTDELIGSVDNLVSINQRG